MTKTCNNCGAEFKWKEPYDGDKMNLDGTPHICITNKPAPTQAATVSIDRTAVIVEIKEFLQAFQGSSPDELDAASRIYISRTMERRR